jgi:hypothetical protein
MSNTTVTSELPWLMLVIMQWLHTNRRGNRVILTTEHCSKMAGPNGVSFGTRSL